ncbi:natterin-4-like [Pempheris klunzingeri]|uniref:natterin-4-like n=1 Tax=Pempheris klunzingeri TaxID=3127111 RepID=UPI0039802AC8
MMMKLSVLFLLVLPAPSSAGLQDIMEKSSQSKNVSILSSSRTTTTQHFLLPPTLKRKRRSSPSTFVFEDSSNLEWVTWNGSLPDGSFIFSNVYDNRIDYVCKYKCEAGYYNEGMGSFCYYPYDGEELRSKKFEILVNKDNFEVLEWKDGSYASLPQNSVRTCNSVKMYVGKNKYGLGKVHVEHGSFYLPWRGYEYYYKSYQSLTYSHSVHNEHISNVKYNTDGVEILKSPPETIRTTTITNYECSPVMKTTTLSKTNRLEKRWDIGSSISLGVTKSFTGGIPAVASAGVSISAEVSFQFSGGHTRTEESSHSMAVTLTVPPNHSCTARLVGHKYTATIPFTAHLCRTYNDGKTTCTVITGVYDSMDIGEVQAVVDRCQPVPGAKACPQRRACDSFS